MNNKTKNSPVSELTEKFDELVSLDTLKFDDDNIKLKYCQKKDLDTDKIFNQPKNNYTKELLKSVI